MSNEPELIVTNMHRNFTGVSATAAAVIRKQASQYNVMLAGNALPGGPAPITIRQAIKLSRRPPRGRSHIIWHVRRNNEMRAALWVRDILRRPIKIVFTSAAQRHHSTLPKWLISRMDAVIATTDIAASLVPHVRAVVQHGVDTEIFHPSNDLANDWKNTGWPGSMGVATIGRIRPEKGTDIFVDAMIDILPQFPDLTALIIGKAKAEHRSFETQLRERIEKAGLSERIMFTGEIKPGNLPAIVRSLSLLVACPRYEGFGLTPLEAMASAVPIVATDTGYFSSFIGANEAGTLVTKPQATEIAAAVKRLFDSPLELALKSNNARERAAGRFALDGEVMGINAVYQKLWDQG